MWIPDEEPVGAAPVGWKCGSGNEGFFLSPQTHLCHSRDGLQAVPVIRAGAVCPHQVGSEGLGWRPFDCFM